MLFALAWRWWQRHRRKTPWTRLSIQYLWSGFFCPGSRHLPSDNFISKPGMVAPVSVLERVPNGILALIFHELICDIRCTVTLWSFFLSISGSSFHIAWVGNRTTACFAHTSLIVPLQDDMYRRERRDFWSCSWSAEIWFRRRRFCVPWFPETEISKVMKA